MVRFEHTAFAAHKRAPQGIVAVVSCHRLAPSFMANNIGPDHQLAPSWLAANGYTDMLPLTPR
ncbi:MAG: hypothetical protein NNA23_08455 [Nitrospira sp.]|nr:hypothetical protein [Nitrospira sp.]